ncbi:membrane progestin receptor alpha-like [Mercenaria mercenaria]|uniref:membrane progestin receptor alpha-like n=1 Tax=Mercenaria mercenaria TaxID=6596 RepID=UPI00234E6C08|nr:membrane progestin receptor alpha-like [Mercenaria mercenaria]XP_045159653.2 membrane progestin receptor alpha-like [Mercenaria mercenaria]
MSLTAFRRVTFKETEWQELLFQAQSFGNHHDIPVIYREPGILTGYRLPGMSWLYYVVSVLQFHNETINIWTHTIATVIFIQKILYILETTDVQTDCEALPLIFFAVCVSTNSFLSAFAHTFHSKSPFCHYICFLLDYAGVGFYSLGQGILFLYILCPNNVYEYLERTSLPVNVCLSWVVTLGGCLSKLLYRRPYPFKRRLIQLASGCIHASFASIPLVSRLIYCFIDKDCKISTFCSHFLWMATMVLCLFFFSSHLPEKRAPGKFDFIGQGHQLFHVFQAVTALLQFKAAQEDGRLNNGGSAWSCHYVNGKDLVSAVTVYAFGCIMIILLMVKLVRERIESDQKSA